MGIGEREGLMSCLRMLGSWLRECWCMDKGHCRADPSSPEGLYTAQGYTLQFGTNVGIIRSTHRPADYSSASAIIVSSRCSSPSSALQQAE